VLSGDGLGEAHSLGLILITELICQAANQESENEGLVTIIREIYNVY
jgi:hypothetical protein